MSDDNVCSECGKDWDFALKEIHGDHYHVKFYCDKCHHESVMKNEESKSECSYCGKSKD